MNKEFCFDAIDTSHLNRPNRAGYVVIFSDFDSLLKLYPVFPSYSVCSLYYLLKNPEKMA